MNWRSATVAVRWLRQTELGPPSACWKWLGAKNKSGHGVIGVGPKKLQGPHRVAYELFIGPIPEGAHLDHLCARWPGGLGPSCVNPWHLEPVSLFENVARSGKQVAVLNRAKTHCPQGHPYDEKNTGHSAGNRRYCRACHRDRARAKYVAR